MPKRFTRPGTPCTAGPSMRKSAAGWVGPRARAGSKLRVAFQDQRFASANRQGTRDCEPYDSGTYDDCVHCVHRDAFYRFEYDRRIRDSRRSQCPL
jgi:hypothetical protein